MTSFRSDRVTLRHQLGILSNAPLAMFGSNIIAGPSVDQGNTQTVRSMSTMAPPTPIRADELAALCAVSCSLHGVAAKTTLCAFLLLSSIIVRFLSLTFVGRCKTHPVRFIIHYSQQATSVCCADASAAFIAKKRVGAHPARSAPEGREVS